jgi:hypothetical protein
MADSIEDKGRLKERLDEDRRKMASEVGELKKDYSPLNCLKASVETNPLYWVVGALLLGFLISRLPARRKIIYIPQDSAEAMRATKHSTAKVITNRSQILRKVWTLIKPVITAYVAGEIYKHTRTRPPDVTPA